MIMGSRRSILSRGNDRVLIHSTLFLVCALISAMGAGFLAALAFLPAAGAVEVAAYCGRDDSQPRAPRIQAC